MFSSSLLHVSTVMVPGLIVCFLTVISGTLASTLPHSGTVTEAE